MDSREILRQFNVGALFESSAVSELSNLLGDTSTLPKMQEAARARYAMGFIRRAGQYMRGEITGRDLCLNIRDLVLVMGRVRLKEYLYRAVQDYGAEYDLICENDLYVSCDLHTPDWLAPEQYISDVYAFRQNDVIELEKKSAGDALLCGHTVFSSYKSFEQKIAVHSALNLPQGDTLLISQPTGGGKSLVTQLLSSTTQGLTVVIVPTVALALDQYYAAQKKLKRKTGIFCYRGEQAEAERVVILEAIKARSAKLLFTSPEAVLKNQELHSLLDRAAEDGYLANVVVDEAHVVPDWGVFFRPDFQLFSIVLKKWKSRPGNCIRTYLLSATLSDDVVETLFTLFGTEGHNKQVRCDTLRQEPRFYFHSVKSPDEKDEKTLEAMRLLPKPMVIYVLEPVEARKLQKKLQQIGYKNIPVFTGETKDRVRDEILTGWKKNAYDVIIATSAFGIGVDKPDVRTILHACCPENLSRYYQEVGRGGRDHLPSLSLFMPYQNRYDGDGDVRRAWGLVNKRVLSVEKSVARWNGMLKDPAAVIDGDQCILDTSATPSTMTDEEAEYAGNRNVAWNVNLLLFLHRTGFIDLLDARYVLDPQVKPPRKYYSVTVKLLKPEILGDTDLLSKALEEPRQKEYDAQLEGYRIMSELVSAPRRKCWGRVFKHLFPLSSEVCNGCPADMQGRVTLDDDFKLRMDPGIVKPPVRPGRKLARSIGSYRQLIVKRINEGPCQLDEVEQVVERANQNEIGAVVVPERFAGMVSAIGLLLNYDEFFFVVEHCPYLLAGGVVCIFDQDESLNQVLYRNLKMLERFGYYQILCCNEKAVRTGRGKTLRDQLDGYAIPMEKF